MEEVKNASIVEVDCHETVRLFGADSISGKSFSIVHKDSSFDISRFSNSDRVSIETVDEIVEDLGEKNIATSQERPIEQKSPKKTVTNHRAQRWLNEFEKTGNANKANSVLDSPNRSEDALAKADREINEVISQILGGSELTNPRLEVVAILPNLDYLNRADLIQLDSLVSSLLTDDNLTSNKQISNFLKFFKDMTQFRIQKLDRD